MKTFNNLDEFIQDEYFNLFLHREINEVLNKRRFRELPPVGFRYKRDWYDRFGDEFDIDFCLKNIKDIWLRKSSLNSETRNIILYVCENARIKTLLKYSELEQQTNAEHGILNAETETTNKKQRTRNTKQRTTNIQTTKQ